MIAKAKYLQFFTASTCVAATVGGGYYCFNERKGENHNSLNVSNFSDAELIESFLPIFSFEAYDEKIGLKEKVNGLITMASTLNKNIDKLSENNLSFLKNVIDSSDDEGDSEPSDIVADDEDDNEGASDVEEESDMAKNITNLVTSLTELFATDNEATAEINKLSTNNEQLKKIFEKIASNKKP